MGVGSYQILDVGLVLESSSERFLGMFHQDYARFQVPGPPEGRRLSVRFQDGPGAFLDVDGALTSLADHPNPEGHAALTIAQALMDRVEAYTILHAAVVGAPGGALALSGPSGAGKTTLTLALLEAGCAYLSDDFCPVHRETGLVHPFPRSLWVRGKPGEASSNLHQGKVLYPLDGQRFPLGDRPLPLRWLVCLDAETGSGAPAEMRVSLREGREAPFLEAVRALEGATMEKAGGLEWSIVYPRKEGLTARLRDLLQVHGDACWNAYAVAGARPDFTREPALVPIPAFEAAFFLLRELKHALPERPGALLHHLTGLLAGTACHRLTPGPLDRRLALVRESILEERA
jgi:hypothetical protein